MVKYTIMYTPKEGEDTIIASGGERTLDAAPTGLRRWWGMFFYTDAIPTGFKRVLESAKVFV